LTCKCLDGLEYLHAVARCGHPDVLQNIVVEIWKQVETDRLLLEGVGILNQSYAIQPLPDTLHARSPPREHRTIHDGSQSCHPQLKPEIIGLRGLWRRWILTGYLLDTYMTSCLPVLTCRVMVSHLAYWRDEESRRSRRQPTPAQFEGGLGRIRSYAPSRDCFPRFGAFRLVGRV